MLLETAGQTEMTNEQPVKLSYIFITWWVILFIIGLSPRENNRSFFLNKNGNGDNCFLVNIFLTNQPCC